jgi:multiple sugar transport system permease protein
MPTGALGQKPQSFGSTTAVRAPVQDSFRRKISRLFQREHVLGYTLIAPAFILLGVLVAWPFFMALYFSVTDSWVGQPGSFIGLRNYWNLLHDGIFIQTLQNSFVFTFSAVILKTVLGMALALLLFRAVRFKKWVRGAVLLPWVIPTALSTLGWWWMFDSLYSVFNWTLVHLGIVQVGPNWLGTPYLAKIAVIIVNVWRGLPFFAITILAGLVSIPQELYEAAKTDGAGAWARFWYITVPMLKPVLIAVTFIRLMDAMRLVDEAVMLTKGGPGDATRFLGLQLVRIVFENNDYGYGGTVSLFALYITLVVSWALYTVTTGIKRARANGG